MQNSSSSSRRYKPRKLKWEVKLDTLKMICPADPKEKDGIGVLQEDRNITPYRKLTWNLNMLSLKIWKGDARLVEYTIPVWGSKPFFCGVQCNSFHLYLFLPSDFMAKASDMTKSGSCCCRNVAWAIFFNKILWEVPSDALGVFVADGFVNRLKPIVWQVVKVAFDKG